MALKLRRAFGTFAQRHVLLCREEWVILSFIRAQCLCSSPWVWILQRFSRAASKIFILYELVKTELPVQGLNLRVWQHSSITPLYSPPLMPFHTRALRKKRHKMEGHLHRNGNSVQCYNLSHDKWVLSSSECWEDSAWRNRGLFYPIPCSEFRDCFFFCFFYNVLLQWCEFCWPMMLTDSI